LYLAAKEGHSDVVQILADVVDDIDAAVGFCGNALCAAATQSSNHDCLKVLLEKGADVNWPGGHYGCALQTATANYRLDNVILLLKYGADVNAQCGHYGNVMTAAARHATHFTEMSRLFLEYGADINAQGPGVYGNALQTAVWLKHTEAVQFLLHNGASPTIQGRFGSAINIAQRNAFRNTSDEKAGERIKWLLNIEDPNELTAAD
jgi:ankyrin repeat protein